MTTDHTGRNRPREYVQYHADTFFLDYLILVTE